MRNKKFLSLLVIIPFVLLLIPNITKDSMLVFATGTPDSYGNQIAECSVWQTGVMKGNVTSANYTSGIQVNVNSFTAMQFNVSVLLNNTLASSTTEAKTNTRVYLNITYSNGTTVISTLEITDYYAVASPSGFYTVKSYYLWNDAVNHPKASTLYYVWLKYEVYR